MKLNVFFCYLVLSIAASSNAQVPRETALTNGWAAMKAINGNAIATFASSTAESDSRLGIPSRARSWTICAGSDTASVNAATGEVGFVTIGDTHDRLFKQAQPSEDPQAIRSSEDAIAQARKWANALGWPVGEKAECNSAFPKLDSNGVGPRASITVRFLGVRDGYRSSSEDVEITMDSVTGEVADASRPTGFTFEPVKLNIDAVQALSIARAAGSGDPTSPAVAEYLTLPVLGSPGESARGLQLGADKVAILGYAIVGDKKAVYIAADTGEVLLSFSSAIGDGKSYLRRLKAQPEQRKAEQQQTAVVRRETYQPPKPPVFEWDKAQLIQAIVAAAALILMPLGWFWWRNRSRNRAV